MARDQREQPPRNHFSIDAPSFEEMRRARKAPPSWRESLCDGLCGCLMLKISTQDPVHVGCGGFVLHEGKMVKDLMRSNGAPVIPGSSLKGAVRQVFELLTASCSPFDERAEVHRNGERMTLEGMSPAGRIFGALGFQGRVAFGDATGEVPIEPISIKVSVAYPPHGSNRGRRFYGPMPDGALQRRTVSALAIPAGTELKTHLRFQGLDESEIGGVLRAMGQATEPGQRFALKLGGAKYDGYGAVKIAVCGGRIHSASGSLAGREHQELALPEAGQFVQRCLAAFVPSPSGARGLEKLVAMLGTGAE